MKAVNSKNTVVLVVDDNPINLKIMVDYLSVSNFEIMVARSGDSALRQIEFAKPDIILLDVMMPGIDGFETCEILKKNEETKDIPVIFITALSDTADKVKGFEVGAVDYITKPFQKEEVIARIKTHLTICSQKRKLEELNATKDKFFSIIAHDMRNVFNGLIGTSWLISESSDKIGSNDLKILGQKMYESSKMAHGLLENLLSWARLHKGAMEFSPQLINLKDLSVKAVKSFQTNIERKNINIFNSIAPNTEAYCDFNMIDTVIRNLVSNAIKFTASGGAVHIYSEQSDEFIEISIQDTGVGIDEEDIKKLLKIDSKFKQPGTEGEIGTGLGLVLCKEFIEKNKGTIKVQSKKGFGSTFTFTLPVSAKQ